MSLHPRARNQKPEPDVESAQIDDAVVRVAAEAPSLAELTPDATQVLDAVATLWIKVRPAMLERVTTIENATLALMEGSLDTALRGEAEREAHKMAGALGSFGFPEGSRLAREIELLLDSPTKLAEDDALRLADLVTDLRRALEREPSDRDLETPSGEPAVDSDVLCLLVVSADSDLSASLRAEAAVRGLHLRVASDSAEVWSEMTESGPAVVLVDLASTDDLGLISDLSELEPDVPILLLADQISFDDRVRFARSGARYVLRKPQSPRKLVDAALHALPERTAADATILVVDDDAELLSLLDTILTPAGYRLNLVDRPEMFWGALEESPPDLVILDVDMPDISGLDLCRMLRNDPARDALPVLFLTVQTEPATVQRIFAAGADDYVTKPIVGPELLTRVSNRLERARLQRAMVESDPLTGLANRHKAELAFDQFFRLAARQGAPVTLSIVDVDRFQQINEQHGHATADQMLRHLSHLMLQRFRGHDVAARWDDQKFVVGMFGASRDIAVLRLSEILDAFRHEEFVDPEGAVFSATFSAGVAIYPGDGNTLNELYRVADAALCQAKTTGSARVIPSGWVGEPHLVEHSVDVALVEDDTALSSLLLHALANRGYRTEWFPDGEEAALAFTRPQSRIQARVILLDVGLPGLDGFDVLKRLVDNGITQRTRVIMLTAHTAESEVLEALELGAFDHVAKPFSTPVLLQRIRRAIHD